MAGQEEIGVGQDQLTNLHHELELEELEKSEQRKLEEAIQQAYENENGAEMDDHTLPSAVSINEGKKGNNSMAI